MARRAELHMTAQDWARSSFVRSLTFETNQAVRVLAYPNKQTHHRAWLGSIDRTGVSANLRILFACNPAPGWVPDILAPPPTAADRSIEQELADITDYPRELVSADLRQSLESHPTPSRRAVLEPLIADPTAALEAIAAELRWAWEHLLAPFWPPVRELIAADINYRSREITRVGLGGMLAELHPAVSIDGGSVHVVQSDDVSLELAGSGLALMPSAFVWRDVVLFHQPPWPVTLVYPARGIAELWSAPPVPPSALADILGYTRALLLADLAEPSTTKALAIRHKLSPAAVSTQLGRLRAAGLVAGQRTGKEVHYRRTRLADALLRGR